MRIQKRNEWGYLKYYKPTGGLIVASSGTVELMDGTTCEFHAVPHTEQIWDNSAWPYTVESKRLLVRIPFQDGTIDVPLEDVDILHLETP